MGWGPERDTHSQRATKPASQPASHQIHLKRYQNLKNVTMGFPEIPTSGHSTLKKLKSQLPLHRNLRSVRQQNPSVAPKLQQAACGIPSCGLNHNTFLCLCLCLSFVFTVFFWLLFYALDCDCCCSNPARSTQFFCTRHISFPSLLLVFPCSSFAPGIFLSIPSSA